jgi:anti-sigma B factor antagonist
VWFAGPEAAPGGDTLDRVTDRSTPEELMVFDLDVTTHDDGVAVVAVLGEVDVATAPTLRQELLRLATESTGPPRIVVDLAGVDFLDSTGLGVLLGSLKRVRAKDGALALSRAEPHVRKVFEITRVIEILPVLDDVDAALATVRA